VAMLVAQEHLSLVEERDDDRVSFDRW